MKLKCEPQLQHCAKRIARQSLEKVVEVFGILGCKLVYMPESKYRWAMVAQDHIFFNIQLTEVDEKPIIDKLKICSHIAFISDNPAEHIERVEKWAHRNGIKFIKGSWNSKELYFDLPEIFIDWVIEVMHTSVTED